MQTGEFYHVRPPHGLAHAVQGLRGRPCQHEILGCLDCANAVRARQVRGAVLLQASNDRGHKVWSKPGSTGEPVVGDGTIRLMEGKHQSCQPRQHVGGDSALPVQEAEK